MKEYSNKKHEIRELKKKEIDEMKARRKRA